MRKTRVLLILLLAGLFSTLQAADYTLSQLSSKIDRVQNQEIVLTGNVLGCCKSGCKMWVGEGEYHEGDPFILVRAKDDAFKFDTKASGKTVRVTGYAVGQLIDACANEGEKHAENGEKDECATPAQQAGAKTETAKAEPAKEKEMTFFATKVEYN